jgi:hypothetical protein
VRFKGSIKLGIISLTLIIIALGFMLYSQISIFIIQPIGAVPEGRTLIIGRLTNVNFIDSADGICERQMGGVNLLCRGAVIAKIVSIATIYVRLPYSETLYGISTGGRTFDR